MWTRAVRRPPQLRAPPGRADTRGHAEREQRKLTERAGRTKRLRGGQPPTTAARKAADELLQVGGVPEQAAFASVHDGRNVKRDDRAWNALVDRFSDLIWSVAGAHQLSEADACDVAQSAWLRLVERRPTPSTRGLRRRTGGSRQSADRRQPRSSRAARSRFDAAARHVHDGDIGSMTNRRPTTRDNLTGPRPTGLACVPVPLLPEGPRVRAAECRPTGDRGRRLPLVGPRRERPGRRSAPGSKSWPPWA